MSDEAAKPPSPAVPAAKSSKSVLGLLLLNLGATGFIVFRTITAQPAEAGTHGQAPGSGSATATTEITGPVLALDPFVVNLDEPGTSRYLKITLELELEPDSEAAMAKSKQLVRDTILSYLSGLHLKDTLGAEAKDKIRIELMAKIEKLMGPHKVRRMFFQEFVVQ